MTYFKVGEKLFAVPIIRVEGHELYKSDLHRSLFYELYEVTELLSRVGLSECDKKITYIVVKSFHSNYIKFDRFEF